MSNKLEEELISFFQESVHKHVKEMPTEEIKCIEWFVLDADSHIEAKNKKVA